MGLKVFMLTGDSEEVAHGVAEELGIDDYFAQVLPDQKAEKIKVLKNQGYNIVAIPLAAGILSSLGIVINPAIGALLMSLSTVIVAVNSQTLRKSDSP